MPPRYPAPVIEFGMIHGVETDHRLRNTQPQQKPDLLLADTARTGIAPLITRGEAITQPALGAAHEADIVRVKTHLFVQFPVQRLFRGLADVDSTLGKLPAPVAHTTCPQHVAIVAHDNDADIGAKALVVNRFANPFHGALYSRMHCPAVYAIPAVRSGWIEIHMPQP